MRGSWFFFYGTLTEDHDNPVTRRILPLLEGGKRASVQGCLRTVPTPDGWYPVLRGGPGRVAGRLYQAGPSFSLKHLRLLDAYEDCDPRRICRSEYVRRTIRVRTARGGSVMAQVYVYNRPWHPGLRVIAGGDFTAFLAKHHLRAFGSRLDGNRRR
ncbi:gamma-glutamylcyclotransferase family protein [Novosphingobium jiangmenense]|uniref:Gamma-glutamylcyclotransferase n=1 Tax=Novosphingobium jiangmenense TaxID=2791981 RepID=A0ABS0HEX1_9SPHN|nr:gamma-glutamylcyclotransferase [Novosphingobium jiangmenense]